MAEYTQRIDEQIARTLELRGKVSPDALAGLTAEEALGFLRHYSSLRPDAPLTFDGDTLSYLLPPQLPQAGPVRLSPVDQVLAAPVGKSKLDTKMSGGAYPKWTWLLVFSFGLPGGIVAWLVVRDSNPGAAKGLLVMGVVVQIVSTLFGIAMVSSMS